MAPPPGIAKFDSASAMAMALVRLLHGRDFAGLGQSPLLQTLARRADWLPRGLRERAFARLGALEAVEPAQIEAADMADAARWVAQAYPERRYPAIMVGSSNGALLHLAAALRIPWLPQTLLTLVRQRDVHPDRPLQALRAGEETARRFLAANPDCVLHRMHDPSQDRLMLGFVAYYRSKYLRLPDAYRDFIERRLEPGGTLYSIECTLRWPTTRLGERQVFQFGAVGGPTVDEYFRGGERVRDYLRRYRSPVQRWQPPAADGGSPEAEWGFEPALGDDLAAFARRHGYRVVRLVFDEPERPSALVADFHRAWSRERGLPGDRLALESFIVLEPYWTLRTASAPYWMVFNMQPSLDGVNRYLDGVEPYDEIELALFAHGVDSIGLPPIDAWRRLLGRARHRGEFLGLRPGSYPAHFAHFARYSQALRRSGPHHPLPEPPPLARVERFIALNGARHGVRLETTRKGELADPAAGVAEQP